MSEVPDAAVSPLTPLEWKTRQQVKAALAQDAALEAVRRATPAVPAEVVDAEAEERRAWALQKAYMNLPAERQGRDISGEAALVGGRMMLVRYKNGVPAEMAPAVFPGEVVGPGEWEEHDRAWRARRRARENRVLGKFYGRQQCVEDGLFTEAEADAAGIPPDPEPGSVAYRLRNSVR